MGVKSLFFKHWIIYHQCNGTFIKINNVFDQTEHVLFNIKHGEYIFFYVENGRVKKSIFFLSRNRTFAIIVARIDRQVNNQYFSKCTLFAREMNRLSLSHRL